MSSRLTLAPSKHPSVPESTVRLRVDVDESTCATSPDIDRKLAGYKLSGFNVPISRIVAYAGIHYDGEAQDYWDIGQARAQIQSAWQDICNWEPRRELDSNGIGRLAFSQCVNSRRQANFSEVIAVGAGLAVGAIFYDLPYRFWRPTPGLSPYDFRAPGPNGSEIQLEVRGRFDGQGIAQAKQQVRAKFGASANLAHQLGVIFTPHTEVDSTAVDVILVDPESDGAVDMASHRELRALLHHYAPFFARQNFGDFAKRLTELAEATDPEFAVYLAQGDTTLRNASVKRTTFRFDAAEFVGTAFDGIAWPRALAPVSTDIDFSTGAFYWGVWIAIVDALRNGHLRDLADMKVTAGTFVQGRCVYILLDDGTALAWAPTREELFNMP